MANNFDAARLALRSLYPKNDLLVDDKGLPSVMVYIPKFRLCDVLSTTDTSVHPAFIVGGKEIDGFYMGKYQSCRYNGRMYSLGRKDPAASMTVDTFINESRAKGKGWHEVTAAEWAAIALWCHKNGCEPLGNNDYGKDAEESIYSASPSKIEGGKIHRTETGTGPETWSHNGSADGIWDLTGNVYEYAIGVRVINGELQLIANNDAADNECDLGSTSTVWKAIRASDGELITPDGSGTTDGSIKINLSFTSGVYEYCTTKKRAPSGVFSCGFGYLGTDSTIGEKAELMLQALALVPDINLTGDNIDTTYKLAKTSINNGDKSAEFFIARGGSASQDKLPGMFSTHQALDRLVRYDYAGGRLAYVDLPE